MDVVVKNVFEKSSVSEHFLKEILGAPGHLMGRDNSGRNVQFL